MNKQVLEQQFHRTIIFSVLLYALGNPAAYALDYQYVAVTEAPAAASQGPVRAGSLTWQCKGNRCSLGGPWPVPGVSACHSLAQVVGRLRSYGHVNAQLTPAQMQQCNAGVSAAKSTLQTPARVPPAPGGLAGAQFPAAPRGVAPAGQPSGMAGMSVPGPLAGVPLVQATKPPVALPPLRVQTPQPGTGAGLPAPAVGLPGPRSEPAPTPAAAPASPVAILERTLPASARIDTFYSRWICTGNRCTTSRLVNRDFVECQALARSAGRLVSFETPAGQMGPHDLERCNAPVVEGFNITACSGEDDLRGNSTLKFAWYVEGRSFDVAHGQPVFHGIPSHTCATAHIDRLLLAPFPLVDLRQLVFDFHTVQGRGIHIESEDNWDMAEISVQARVIDPGGRASIVQLVDRRDNPVHRFENIDRWYVDVHLP
jgi:hypothetical protein